MLNKGKVADLFFSVQGEGIYAGRPQVFVRFYGCICNCRFCDTRLNSYDKYTPLALHRQIKRFSLPYHSLCLTGGEPLLQRDFLKRFLGLIRYDGTLVYLETNGILAQALAEIIDDVDIIAMDFKLPSSTGMQPYWQQHQRFLKVALQKEVFAKTVICSSTEIEDLDRAVEIMLKLKAKDIPLVLQPNFFELDKTLLARVRSFQKHCAQYLDCVQVIPQLHKLMGVK